MGNGSPQVPAFEFPGAEYFALAPGRTIALGPRLVATQTSALVTVAASGQNEADNDLLIAPQFQRTSGIYIARCNGVFVPADGSGKLQITAVRLGLGPPPLNNVQLDIGIPYATLTTPSGAIVAIGDQSDLITGIDFGPGSIFATSGALHLYPRIVCNNLDAGASHQFQWITICVYHQLEGFVQ